MKKYLTIALAILFASLALTACERKHKAEAASEEDPHAYQPLPAPDAGLKPGDLIRGEISKVDIGNKMMVVRLENGMDQTLKLADDTQVVVTAVDPNGVRIDLKQLSTQYRSDVVIQWKDVDGSKVATSIDVTSQPQKRYKRRR
jgi:hypothetical protein